MVNEATVDEHVRGVRSGDRAALARAITLVESTRPDHREVAAAVLERLVGQVGSAWRIGITGVPGVGKSTFIDQFGTNLTSAGHRVAVLAVDPTSQRSGGSILGDKTRMERLAVDPDAFIRPSPAGTTLGGVSRATREAMILCEAAGFDVVLIETVGVGQSETVVAEMVDFFLVLMLAGAGDELQGIKRGVLELADAVAVNKADGDNVTAAETAAVTYRQALHLMTPMSASWVPPVMTCSALHDRSLDAIWDQIVAHRERLEVSGELAAKRQGQDVRWMWSMVADRLMEQFRGTPSVEARVGELEAAVRAGRLAPTIAADRLLSAFRTG